MEYRINTIFHFFCSKPNQYAILAFKRKQTAHLSFKILLFDALLFKKSVGTGID